MIAFIDAEYNCDEARTQMYLLEVGLLICEETKKNIKVVKTYHTYVQLPEGQKIYSRIVDLTGITEDNIQQGVVFQESFLKLAQLLEQYNVTKVYCYGSFDKIAFEWNCRKAHITKSFYKKVLPLFCDMEVTVRKRWELKECISLYGALYLYSYEVASKHNALEDAKSLQMLYAFLKQTPIPKLLRSYQRYCKERECFRAYKNLQQRVTQLGCSFADFQSILDDETKNRKYLTFEECLDRIGIL